MKNKKILSIFVGTFSLVAIFAVSQVFGAGGSGGGGNTWTPPSAAFPNGNTTAPIDVGSSAQTKSASLGASGFKATSQNGDAGLLIYPNTPISSVDGKSFYLSQSAGYSVLLNLAGPFVVNTKGLSIPNYAPTTIGESVPAGTLTYNNGKLYLFTGPTGGSGGGSGTSLNDSVNKFGLEFLKAFAQVPATGQGWVEVGGTNINNTNITAGGPWVRTGSTVYTTGTIVSVGSQNGPAIASNNGALELKVSSGGSQQSNNSLIPSANAQSVSWITGLSINTNGRVSIPTSLLLGNNAANSYTFENNSGTLTFRNAATVSRLQIGQDGAVIFNGVLRSQTPELEYLGSLSNATVAYYPTNTTFCVGTGNPGLTCTPPPQFSGTPACGCSNTGTGNQSTPRPDTCSNTSMVPTENVGTQCYSWYNPGSVTGGGSESSLGTPIANSSKNKLSSLFGIEKTYAYPTYGWVRIYNVGNAQTAKLKLGGNIGGTTNRAGMLSLSDSSGNLTDLNIVGGQLAVSAVNGVKSSAFSLNDSARFKAEHLSASLCSNGKFMTVGSDGDVICQAFPTSQQLTVTWPPYGVSGTGRGVNNTKDMGVHKFCALSSVLFGNSGGNGSRQHCYVEKSGSNWILHAATGGGGATDGNQEASCGAICFD